MTARRRLQPAPLRALVRYRIALCILSRRTKYVLHPRKTLGHAKSQPLLQWIPLIAMHPKALPPHPTTHLSKDHSRPLEEIPQLVSDRSRPPVSDRVACGAYAPAPDRPAPRPDSSTNSSIILKKKRRHMLTSASAPVAKKITALATTNHNRNHQQSPPTRIPPP